MPLMCHVFATLTYQFKKLEYTLSRQANRIRQKIHSILITHFLRGIQNSNTEMRPSQGKSFHHIAHIYVGEEKERFQMQGI